MIRNLVPEMNNKSSDLLATVTENRQFSQEHDNASAVVSKLNSRVAPIKESENQTAFSANSGFASSTLSSKYDPMQSSSLAPIQETSFTERGKSFKRHHSLFGRGYGRDHRYKRETPRGDREADAIVMRELGKNLQLDANLAFHHIVEHFKVNWEC